jgi:urea transport system substrate-binding protein
VKPQDTPTLSFSIGEQEVRNLDPAQMAGDYAAWNYFQSLDTPESKQFVSRFLGHFGQQRAVTDPMESAYIGVKLWAKAVQKAGSDSPVKIRHGFDDQKLLAPEGEVTICPATHHAYKTPRVGQLQPNGQFEVVWNGVKPIKPEPFPDTRTRAQWETYLHELYAGWGNQWAAPEE